MDDAMRYIRFFVMVLFCSNSFMMVAGDRSFDPYSSLRAGSSGGKTKSGWLSGKDSDKSGGLMMFMGGGLVKIINNVDLSGAKKIAHDNKLMVITAAGIAGLLVLINHIKNSEKFGPWLNEKYKAISDSVENNKNYCIGQLPVTVQVAIWPLEVLIKYVYGALKKYIAMSKTTIISSISSPVVGKLLDCCFVCPIPFCSFAAFGYISSGIIVAKGYFNQQFEKVEKQINASDQKNEKLHGETKAKIDEVFNSINSISSKISSLKTEVGEKIDNVANSLIENEQKNMEAHFKTQEEVKNVSVALSNVTAQIINLGEQINKREKKDNEHATEVKNLLEQLNNASDRLITAKKDFGDLLGKLGDQMENMQIQLTVQDNRSQETGKMIVELIHEISEHNKVLQVIQKVQEDEKSSLLTIHTKIGKIEQTNEDFFGLLGKLQQSQDDSILKVTQLLSSLQDNQKHYDVKINAFLDKLKECESNVALVQADVRQNHEYVVGELKAVGTKLDNNNEMLISRLMEELEKRDKATAEKEKKHLEQMNVLSNSVEQLRKDLAVNANRLQQGQSDILSAITQNNTKRITSGEPSYNSFSFDQRLQIGGSKQHPATIQWQFQGDRNNDSLGLAHIKDESYS